MSKYLRARREQNLDPVDAVRYSFKTVGTAMWVTTAALVTGFMILSMSGFKLNADMGLMTAITITLALVLDFLFLLPITAAAETPEESEINFRNRVVPIMILDFLRIGL